MPDNKNLTGKADRNCVSAEEDYEVRVLAKKFDMPPPLVKNVIAQEGPMRRDVEAYLTKMKAGNK